MKNFILIIILLVLNSFRLVQAQFLELNEESPKTSITLSADIQMNSLVDINDEYFSSHTTEQGFDKLDTRPNILVIFVDDLDQSTFGFMGNSIIQTPNVDRLAQQGVVFNNAFVTTATCITSRGTFMTGRYAARTGIYFDQFNELNNEHVKMIYPRILNEAGYHTGYVGKWHLGPVPKGVFDDDQKFLGQGRFWNDFTDDQNNPGQDRSLDKDKWVEDGKHLTDRLGDQAVEMIRNAPEDQPFAITVGFKAPHVQDGFHPVEPYPASPSTAVLYELEEIPAPLLSDKEFFDNQPELIQESLGRLRWDYRLGPPESLNFQRSIRRYYRMVTGVDEQLGKMMNTLRETNRLDNTIIVFTSDHGMYLGERGLAGKWFGHDTSIRIPLIVYDPRLPDSEKGTQRDPMVLMIDFHPTFLEWAKLSADEGVQGRSFVPILNGTTPNNWRSEFFYEHHSFAQMIPRNEGVRTERYKYLNFLDSDPLHEELYDLQADPHEEINLANDPEHADLLQQLRVKWEQWRQDVRKD